MKRRLDRTALHMLRELPRTTSYMPSEAAHTDDVPDDEARLSGVVVPDDISELAGDIAAYRREVRRAARDRRRRELLARRGVVPALVLLAATLLAGVVAVLLSVMAPRTAGHPPAPAELATPNQAPGTIGGLLPSATLVTEDGTTLDAHSPTLRPQVFALVPPHCGCGELVNAISGQAGSEQLRLAIVVPGASDDATASITDALELGRPSTYFDPHATLATAVASSGVTIVVVDADGTIYEIEKNVTDPTKTTLDAALQTMLLADRRESAGGA